MTVTALASASLWDSLYFPGNLNTEPRAQRSATVVEGAPASLRSADDSYTPGARSNQHNSVQVANPTASNAVNLTALTSSNPAASLAGATLANGIPLSLLGGVSSAANSGLGQAQAGTSTTATGQVLSQLNAAISAAASDGSQDSSWLDDLVSYASGLNGGTVSAGGGSGVGGSGAGGALSSDLSAIEQVIQRVGSQVSSVLAAQGASPGQLSAAVNALTTSLTLNSLGAVAQQIAAKTGSANTFTVTSSVVTITANGTSTIANVAGETETFSGASSSLALTTTSGAATLAGGSAAGGDGASQNASGVGYKFSISESGPDGNAFAGTSNVEADATATSSAGAGGSASATAALEEGSTVYENASGNSAANNTAMVLLSDWEANLESTPTQNTVNAGDATSGQHAQPAQSGGRTMADFFNAAAHVLFKQALALLEGIFGAGNSNAAGETGLGQFVDVYA